MKEHMMCCERAREEELHRQCSPDAGYMGGFGHRWVFGEHEAVAPKSSIGQTKGDGHKLIGDAHLLAVLG